MTAPRAEMLARVDAFVSENESRHAKAKARGQVEVHLSIKDFARIDAATSEGASS